MVSLSHSCHYIEILYGNTNTAQQNLTQVVTSSGNDTQWETLVIILLLVLVVACHSEMRDRPLQQPSC
eukprot:5449110-Amphidinium_carterae.2